MSEQEGPREAVTLAEVEQAHHRLHRERKRLPSPVVITRSQADAFEQWRASEDFVVRLRDYDGRCPFCARDMRIRFGGALPAAEWKCGSYFATKNHIPTNGRFLRSSTCINSPYAVIPDRARPSYRPPVPLIEL